MAMVEDKGKYPDVRAFDVLDQGEALEVLNSVEVARPLTVSVACRLTIL